MYSGTVMPWQSSWSRRVDHLERDRVVEDGARSDVAGVLESSYEAPAAAPLTLKSAAEHVPTPSQASRRGSRR